MIYADDLLKSIVHTITTGNLLSRSDRDTLASICRGAESEMYITENQSKLALRLIVENTNQLSQYADDINNVVQNTRWREPFRKIDIVKTVRISKVSDDETAIVIESSHNIKNRSFWDILRDFTDVVAIESNKSYFIPLTEQNIVLVIDKFKPCGFEIDDTLMEFYNTIKSWNIDEYVTQYNIENNTAPNFHRAIAEDVGDISTVSKSILVDRSTRYNYNAEIVTDGTPLMMSLCNRVDPTVWVSNQDNSMAEVLATLTELKRLPVLIVFDSWSDERNYHELDALSLAFETAGITEVGVYFRLSNGDYGKQFNQMISDKKYNKRLDDNLQVAIVQSGKLPKFFLKEDWEPMSAITLGSRMTMRHGKVSVYLKNTDLIVEYAEKPSLMDGINGSKISYKR